MGIEEWIKLLEEERKGLVYFFIGSLVESVNQRLKTVSKLKRADARIESKVRKYLQKMGRQVPSELSTHLKAIEKDIKNVEKVSKALTFIEYSMKAADAGDKLSKKEWLEIAKMVLELGLKDPKLSLLVKGVDSFVTLAKTAGVYAISDKVLDDLNNKTMNDLRQLKILSARIQSNTKMLLDKQGQLKKLY